MLKKMALIWPASCSRDFFIILLQDCLPHSSHIPASWLCHRFVASCVLQQVSLEEGTRPSSPWSEMDFG